MRKKKIQNEEERKKLKEKINYHLGQTMKFEIKSIQAKKFYE